MRLLLAVVIVLAGCTSTPPERVERDRMVLAAIQPCRERYSDYFHMDAISVNQDGRVRYWYKDYQVARVPEVQACINQALQNTKVGPWAPARVAKAAPSDVSITATPQQILVPVRINGVSGTLMLVQKSGLTYVKPAFAERAGLRVVASAPTTYVRFEGMERAIETPFVRARTFEIGDAVLEALDIAVYDNAKIGAADGVVGANVLQQFNVNVDRRNSRLRLDPKTF